MDDLRVRDGVTLAFGDAGQAVEASRTVDVSTLAVPERRAVFWTDLARALHGCGRDEKAVLALLAAEREAPEEVRSRMVVRELIGDLVMRHCGGHTSDLRSLAAGAQVNV